MVKDGVRRRDACVVMGNLNAKAGDVEDRERERVGLESLNSADEIRMVRGWQVFEKSTNWY